jgi:hypothetical protein
MGVRSGAAARLSKEIVLFSSDGSRLASATSLLFASQFAMSALESTLR